MATGKKRTVTKLVETTVDDGITLELSDSEADTLLMILRRVGGIGPMRNDVANMISALYAAGRKSRPPAEEYQIMEGSLFFNKES